MKKNLNKRIIITFIISGIIFGSIGVYASNLYKASDIAYTKKDGTISNVNDEINNLYEIIENGSNNSNEISIVSLGTATSYNIKEMFPSIDYKQLTNDNFIVGTENADYTFTGTGSSGVHCYPSSGGYDTSVTVSYTCNRSASISKSYDASTGILTVTATNATPFSYLILNPESTVVYLGAGDKEYNIKELYPGIDYTKLTTDNFSVGFTSGSHSYKQSKSVGHRCAQTSGGYDNTQSASFTCTGTISVTKSYDPSTGILTITGTNVSGTFVYLLKGTIIN